ncbi:MAG: hypothetical protein ABIJ31_16115 [Pseudomonadota bacterium]
MKTIKYLLLLIITILIAALVYFNQNFFLATTSLTFNIKDAVYSIPELPTLAYLGICFLFGLILSGINTLSTRFCLNRIIKKQESTINELSARIASLKTDLEVFTHDPYIQKGLENKAEIKTEIEPVTRLEAEIQTLPDMEPALDSDADPNDDVQKTDRTEEESKTIVL